MSGSRTDTGADGRFRFRGLGDGRYRTTIHFTPGQAYEGVADNGNRSQVHWDMVCIQRPDYGGGEIWFDGKLIRKNGKFVPKNLALLNY